MKLTADKIIGSILILLMCYVLSELYVDYRIKKSYIHKGDYKEFTVRHESVTADSKHHVTSCVFAYKIKSIDEATIEFYDKEDNLIGRYTGVLHYGIEE